MKSLKQNLEFFFSEHKTLLGEKYPGLTLEHLTREFLVFAQTLRDFDENLLSTPFCSLKKEDVERFYSGLLKGIPLQQITGKAYFYRSEFLVNRHVLIPRSESEILVEKAVAFAQKNMTKKILEIGVGSGCLILSTLRELSFAVEAWAVDISPEALLMAKINAFRLGFSIHPQTKLHFALSDLLTKLPNDLTFSLIISNPPYIKDSQKATVHQVVDTFEPKIALYISDAEYSQWYIRFFKEVFSVLETDGILIMEGHEENLSDLQNLARQQGFKEVELSFDYTSRLRFLMAKK